ncbi:MAG: CPBP family intramembrane metalloprotease [Ardenticatenaceae bacterium]|nr:CPBP family intramembrane metalloprotease [Ardenticatenaceae bacterium]MCB8989542.1 CPBP family intramembrane metalloprotease [Ardenticatenaceae bacterium]MCB9003085.1 CPBP family intramembrane metalloprotease [Ardenticatenaceae bacterium]
MSLYLILLFIVALVLLANWLTQQNNPTFNILFDRVLLVFNLPIIFSGILLALLSPEAIEVLRTQGGLLLDNFPAAGAAIGLMGGWGVLVSLRGVRQFLARWLPFNPETAVHTLALYFSGFLVGNTLLTLTQGGLTEMAVTAQAADIGDLVVQQALFVLLALFGVGLLIRRNGHALSERLGLLPITGAQIRMGIRWIVILVLVQWVAGAIWALIDPAQSELVDSISGELFSGLDTVWEWFVLALAAGMGEEILFRGALQPVFGVWFTAVLFAVAHVQYGITPITLVVLIIGLVLGHIRQRTNTSVAIFVHFGYNFVLGMLALLALYAQQFVNAGG